MLLKDYIKEKTIKREAFEESLMRKDVVEYYNSKSANELEELFGHEVARMVGFEQKNAHHCYDLWNHTLHTVESVNVDGLDYKDAIALKAAAFFHDIGKPDVVGFNPKTQQQNFINHAVHSVDIAKDVLSKIGYSPEEINRISFFIAHHDDFISYNNTINQENNHHAFIRGITKDTVKEIFIQNQINWSKLGIHCYLPTNTGNEKRDKDNAFANTSNSTKKKYICSYLANNKKPEFVNFAGKPIAVNVDMNDIKSKIETGQFFEDFLPTEKDYYMLLAICRADAMAQSEKILATNPKTNEVYVSDSRERKIETMNQIESFTKEAYEEAIDICQTNILANDVLENETFDFKTTLDDNNITL